MVTQPTAGSSSTSDASMPIRLVFHSGQAWPKLHHPGKKRGPLGSRSHTYTHAHSHKTKLTHTDVNTHNRKYGLETTIQPHLACVLSVFQIKETKILKPNRKHYSRRHIWVKRWRFWACISLCVIFPQRNKQIEAIFCTLHNVITLTIKFHHIPQARLEYFNHIFQFVYQGLHTSIREACPVYQLIDL